MKKLISIISIIVLSISMFAQDSVQVSKPKSKLAYNGYIGGMMLHLGYVYHTELPELGGHTVSALTKGIGGTIKIKFGNHLRVGTEGYVSTANILKNGSYVQSGWGGLLIDTPFKFDRWLIFLGATIGGGSFKAVYMFEGNTDDWKPEERAVYRKSSYGMVAPFFGVEYSLTKVISLIIKCDYMIPYGSGRYGVPAGPRAYIGIGFSR